MPVSQDFKDNMTKLFVNKRINDAATRGIPPVDNLGTRIKKPLARPKAGQAALQQQMLAQAAAASLKKRQTKIQVACTNIDETPKDTTKYTSNANSENNRPLKPSEVKRSNRPKFRN